MIRLLVLFLCLCACGRSTPYALQTADAGTVAPGCSCTICTSECRGEKAGCKADELCHFDGLCRQRCRTDLKEVCRDPDLICRGSFDCDTPIDLCVPR